MAAKDSKAVKRKAAAFKEKAKAEVQETVKEESDHESEPEEVRLF